jgi:hypothetical protein
MTGGGRRLRVTIMNMSSTLGDHVTVFCSLPSWDLDYEKVRKTDLVNCSSSSVLTHFSLPSSHRESLCRSYLWVIHPSGRNKYRTNGLIMIMHTSSRRIASAYRPIVASFHCWWQVVFLWKRGIGNMFSSCFLRKHQRNCIRAYQKRKARGLFPKETLAKRVSLMLFPWETGLGASSVCGSYYTYPWLHEFEIP